MTDSVLVHVYAVTTVASLALAGLTASNVLHDRSVPSAVSRYVAPLLGGAAFLTAVSYLDAWAAIALSGGLTLCILTLRVGFRHGLRGVRGNLPTQAWAEVTCGMAGVSSLAAGWGLFGDRWLAFLHIALIAWGDSIAGLARVTI